MTAALAAAGTHLGRRARWGAWGPLRGPLPPAAQQARRGRMSVEMQRCSWLHHWRQGHMADHRCHDRSMQQQGIKHACRLGSLARPAGSRCRQRPSHGRGTPRRSGPPWCPPSPRSAARPCGRGQAGRQVGGSEPAVATHRLAAQPPHCWLSCPPPRQPAAHLWGQVLSMHCTAPSSPRHSTSSRPIRPTPCGLPSATLSDSAAAYQKFFR